MNFVSVNLLHLVASLQAHVVVAGEFDTLSYVVFLLCLVHSYLSCVFLLLRFSPSLAEDFAHGLVLLPLFELAFARAVPDIFAPRAPLSG